MYECLLLKSSHGPQYRLRYPFVSLNDLFFVVTIGSVCWVNIQILHADLCQFHFNIYNHPVKSSTMQNKNDTTISSEFLYRMSIFLVFL